MGGKSRKISHLNSFNFLQHLVNPEYLRIIFYFIFSKTVLLLLHISD